MTEEDTVKVTIAALLPAPSRLRKVFSFHERRSVSIPPASIFKKDISGVREASED